MNNRIRIITGVLVLLTVSLACTISFGQPSEEMNAETAVAQTVQAKQPDQATDTTEPDGPPTITPKPTDTQPGAPTATPKPCNKAEFISETIPDGTAFDPNDNFTKTWRLKNIGTCTWNTSYQLVFFSGDQMGGPATQNLTQNVAPGEQVDISVNLQAPASAGIYKGYWKIRDDAGEYYVNNIWVQIEVQVGAPPLPPAVASVTLNHIEAEGGSVRSNGGVYGGLENVGDTTGNLGSQVFVSFDMNSIPAGSTITEVKLDFSHYDKLGDPWGSLNCLRLYQHDYGALGAGDFFGGVATGALVRWCNDGELSAVAADSDMISALQSKVGSSRFQARLQFKDMLTDGDGVSDMVRFGTLKLLVTYELP